MKDTSASVRFPAVAGMFYPADPQACRRQAQGYLEGRAVPVEKRLLGGLVPHAGWICSAAIAGQTIAALAQQGPVDVVVVFGAIHTPLPVRFGALDSFQRWSVPGGESPVSEVRQKLQEKGNLFAVDDRLHVREHAVEVEVPLIQLAWPGASILPVEIPPIEDAELMGRKTAQTLLQAGLTAVYLASADLTHYGANYRFTPVGVGPAAMQWTKDNDRRLLDLIEKLEAGRVIAESREHHNTCGAGAIAALIGACRELGASDGRVLAHATSYETLASVQPQPPTQAVGYAGLVVG